MQLNGMQVMSVPCVVRKNRTVYERLFSWPWRPFDTFEFVDNPAAPTKGDCFIASGVIYMREDDFQVLKRENLNGSKGEER